MEKFLKTSLTSFLIIFAIVLYFTITVMPIISKAAITDSAKTYFVSTTGIDSNSGSKTAPFKTLKKAVSMLTAGDTLYIRGGTYYEKIIIKNSGTNSAPITVSNYNNEKVIISGEQSTPTYIDDNSGLISINNKDNINIVGLEIAKYATSKAGVEPIGIAIWNGGNNIHIKNCYIHDIVTSNSSEDAVANAIRADGNNPKKAIDGLVLEGNEIAYNKTGFSETCVLSGNVTNFKIINNKVHDNNNIGILMAGYYDVLKAFPALNITRDGVCSDNLVYNNSSANNASYKGDACAGGIYIDGGKNIVIERNLVYNCDLGIEATSENKGGVCDGAIVRNNIIYNCGLAGISIFGYEKNTGTTNNTQIINNTLYRNEANLYFQTGVIGKNNIIKNNICFSAKSNNIENQSSATKNNNVISNNLTMDPLFVDASNKNFKLKSNSPAINKGDVTNIDPGTLDADKASRIFGSTLDIGAYEYAETTTTEKSNSTVDDGNTKSTATLIHLNVKKQASLSTASDKDWFKFTTTKRGKYKIKSIGTSVDTWGELINSKGKPIASNDNGGGNGNFRITKSLAANTTYYIYVDGNGAGNYSIIVTTP